MGYGYREGAAFGLFVLFSVLVIIMTVGGLLPVLAWYLILMVVVVTCLGTVYRCLKKKSTALGDGETISTISNGRNGVVHSLDATRNTSKKDLPPNYVVATATDTPPPSYAALVHTFKTPTAQPVKKSCAI